MTTMIESIVLSDEIIPAERGKFYNYTSEFTIERPVFAFMKCKANKNRPIEQLSSLGPEANILFCFDDLTRVIAYSIRTAHALGLLDYHINKEFFGETFIGSTKKITAKDFHKIRSHKCISDLVEVCREACSEYGGIVELNEGSVIAMMTDSGKYGIFWVRELTSVSIQITACHILL